MWLTHKLNIHKKFDGLTAGKISVGETVQAEREYRSPCFILPYGIYSVPPVGETGMLWDGCCEGVQAPENSELAPGEVYLSSAGGAEIWLKNNGEVWINGQCFAPKSKL